MKSGQTIGIVVLALVAAAAGFLAAYDRQPPAPAPAPAMVGTSDGELRPVPDFSLVDLAGATRSGAEWSGQVRIVNFWATWCPPCRREIPLLIELQEQYGGRIQVIGIAIDDLEDVRAYAREAGFNYPVLVGQQEAIDLGNAFAPNFVGLPFTVIVDAQDRITQVHVGELHRDEAEAMLGQVL
jgi:thiol-disulfide isomerase/thioredoxin